VTRALFFLFCIAAFSQDSTFSLPAVKTSMDAGGQPITLVASGSVSGNGQAVRLNLSADLSDLQNHITDLLKAELNRSDRCGERLSVERATLRPAAPVAALTASVDYEKWVCVKALGKQITKRLVGGNAIVPVKLTPVVSEGREVKLTGEVGQIQADGSLGEALRSGSFGDALQEKIRQSILRALDKGASLHAALPESVAGLAKISRVAFDDSGGGRLSLDMSAEIAIPFDQARSIIQGKPHGIEPVASGNP
jgi:hypothetical protein